MISGEIRLPTAQGPALVDDRLRRELDYWQEQCLKRTADYDRMTGERDRLREDVDARDEIISSLREQVAGLEHLSERRRSAITGLKAEKEVFSHDYFQAWYAKMKLRRHLAAAEERIAELEEEKRLLLFDLHGKLGADCERSADLSAEMEQATAGYESLYATPAGILETFEAMHKVIFSGPRC